MPYRIDMGVGNEEKSGQERRQQHDPNLETLVNPDFAPQVENILIKVRKGTLDIESGQSQIMQMLTETASKDRKTNLLLGEAVEIKLNRLMRYSQNVGAPLTVVYLDAKDFKLINDHPELGHDEGDNVIKLISQALHATTRDKDLQARLSEEVEEKNHSNEEEHKARVGGDEFVMILAGANAMQAIKVASRFQNKLSGLMEAGAPKIEEKLGSPLKMSVGIAQFDPQIDHDPKSFIKRAEQAMYRNKQESNGAKAA